MDYNKRFCALQGHNKLTISHLCVALKCNQKSRWLCQECLREIIHNHNNLDMDQVITVNEIIPKLQQEIQQNNNIDELQGRVLDQVLVQIDHLEMQINDFKNKIQQLKIKLSDNYMQQIQQLINECQSDQLYEINEFKLDVILQNFNHSNDQLVKDLININDQIKKIENQIIKTKKPKENSKKIDIQLKKYQEQLIDYSNQYYFGSSLSKNEKYLAYGGLNRLIKIYDLQQSKQIFEIKLDADCYCCQFSNDSKQLYVSIGQGYIYCYDVQDKNKLIFVLEIHDRAICNIIAIQNQFIITCSYDYTIIKTDVKSYSQIFKLSGYTSAVLTISYMLNNDIIISGSQDKSIKFWNCYNQRILFIKEQAHNSDIKQIQLIQDQLYLLSLSQDGRLIKWQINLGNNNIQQIQEFNYPKRIYNFYQVNNNDEQFLLTICEKYVKIHNKEGEIVNQIKHSAGPNGYNFHCEQLDSLNIIQIRSQDKIMILKVQN